MPWEAPLDSILQSIEGPVAKIVGTLAIIITGLTLAFGDTSGGFRRLIQIFHTTCETIAYAHSLGVIHRDLKPENIIVLRNNDQIKLKILDFGVAKIQEDLQKLTKTGVVLGSPAYMSPEQCANNELNSYSDQYSLAVLAYEMLAGRRPFMCQSTDITTGTLGERIRVEHFYEGQEFLYRLVKTLSGGVN